MCQKCLDKFTDELVKLANRHNLEAFSAMAVIGGQSTVIGGAAPDSDLDVLVIAVGRVTQDQLNAEARRNGREPVVVDRLAHQKH